VLVVYPHIERTTILPNESVLVIVYMEQQVIWYFDPGAPAYGPPMQGIAAVLYYHTRQEQEGKEQQYLQPPWYEVQGDPVQEMQYAPPYAQEHQQQDQQDTRLLILLVI